MRMTIKLPRVAETVDEVVVVEWVAAQGQVVAAGDALLRIESDKAIVDVPSPVAGRVVEHCVAPDDEISTGAAIAVIESAIEVVG